MIMKKITILTLLLFSFLGLYAQSDSARVQSVQMESVSPNIFVEDMSETIRFYEVLGFQVQEAVPDRSNPFFVLMSCGEVTFLFQTFDSLGEELPEVSRQKGGSLLLYVQVKGIESFYEKLKINDLVKIYRPLEKTFYGANEFSILDNNNYLITFAEDVQQ